ncbi:hypothetical protein NQZ68_002368 [Dissostichus eleginoides]|nr:hypothetical protein NQZ68_002368 [Dissostichus eleginoides]
MAVGLGERSQRTPCAPETEIGSDKWAVVVRYCMWENKEETERTKEGRALPALLSAPRSSVSETRIQAVMSRQWARVNTDANGFLQFRSTGASQWS